MHTSETGTLLVWMDASSKGILTPNEVHSLVFGVCIIFAL